MALAAGTRLGAYEITGQIGAGGMGEVYRARDTRLDRTVAIKVLNSQLVASAELRARFEREAKVISQLQHPHICVLHDVGSENGTEYLVMEFLDGEVLAEKVKRGALATGEMLKIAIEVADALGKAHKAGIIHRDLKPGNVMLTKSGAKLLDFGLAKPMAANAAAASGSASVFAAAATMTSPASPLSSAGTVIGTVQYMAPEQIQGQEADARSDVFAFGVMLYEMATGKRAFEGKTQSSIVGQILAVDPPPIAAVQPMSPPALSRLVQTCLAKDPDERFQTIHDVKLRLQEIAEAPNAGRPAANAASSSRALLGFTSAAALLMALATIMVFSFLKRTPQAEPTRFQMDLGELQVVLRVSGSRLAISPDGRTVVMLLQGQTSKAQLYVRSLDSFEVTPLPGTEGASQPFFSPDSKWVGFSQSGKLKKMPLAGSVAVAICDLPNDSASATWGEGGNIIFDTGAGLDVVPSDGGTPSAVDLGNNNYRWPVFLPGGKNVLAVTRRSGRFDIDLIRLDTHKVENLIRDGSWPRYLRSGQILYAQHSSGSDSSGFTGGILAVPFSLKTLQKTGPSAPVLQDVQVGTGGAAYYDISVNGTLAFVPGSSEAFQNAELVSTDPSGKTTIGLGAPPHHFHHLRMSPDGKRLMFTVMDAGPDIYTYDIARKAMQRLTFDKHSQSGIFTPDGKRIIYVSSGTDQQGFWSKPADGSGEAVRVLRSDAFPTPDSVSPDGKTMVFTEVHPYLGIDIYIATLQGDPSPHPFLATKFAEGQAEFSPDGKFIAYTSDESGQSEVYVQSSTGNGGKWQVSAGDGTTSRWSRDGKKIFYLTRSGSRLMSVDVSISRSFASGTPHPVFEANDFGHGGYAITSDGHFLWAKTSVAISRLNQLRVIENFDTQIARNTGASQP